MGTKVQGIGEVTCLTSRERDDSTPANVSPFNHSNKTCQPDLEGVGEIKLGELRFVADLLWGENATSTQAAGVKTEVPIDLVQAYVEYGRTLYGGLGRRVTRMGVEVIRADQNDLTLRDPNFGWIPYTETGGWVGYRREGTEFVVGLIRGPDRVSDNNGALYGVASLKLGFSDQFSVVQNFEAGPDQDDNTDRFRITADTALLYAPSPVVSLKAYFLVGTERFEREGQAVSQSWEGANLYLKLRPFDLPVSFVARGSYSHDDGARSGIQDLRLVGVTVGGNLELPDHSGEVRLGIQHMESVGETSPFSAGDGQTRFSAQLVFTL